jgi:hypothetical protein
LFSLSFFSSLRLILPFFQFKNYTCGHVNMCLYFHNFRKTIEAPGVAESSLLLQNSSSSSQRRRKQKRIIFFSWGPDASQSYVHVFLYWRAILIGQRGQLGGKIQFLRTLKPGSSWKYYTGTSTLVPRNRRLLELTRTSQTVLLLEDRPTVVKSQVVFFFLFQSIPLFSASLNCDLSSFR